MSHPYRPKRAASSGKGGLTLSILVAAAVVCICLLLLPSAGKSPAAEASAPVSQSGVPSAEPTATPASTPAETPAPTPESDPPAVFDFTQPVPQSDPVEMDYFSDALFIGDSRTDGLRIYSGIKGATFYCYKGLNIFDMSKRQVVEMNGGKYTVADALKKRPRHYT